MITSTIDKCDTSNFAYLTGLPSGNGGFSQALRRASIEELKEALKYLESKEQTKTACKKISSRIRKLEREAKNENPN